MAGPKLSNFQGITAVITGASSGMGRIFTKRIAAMGARVAIVARREDELNILAKEITDAGGEALVIVCDVSILDDCKAACKKALDHYGHIDLLYNNAGYGRHMSFLEWDIEDQVRMMEINYFGMMYFTKLLLPQMVERRKGWILFTSSVAGKLATPDETAYAATKFATTGLAEALSLEVEDYNIHVLNICPGAINTGFFTEEALERMPPVAKNNMGDPDILVDKILKALEKGKYEMTYPGGISPGYVVRALAPEFMRKQVKRVTIDAVDILKNRY